MSISRFFLLVVLLFHTLVNCHDASCTTSGECSHMEEYPPHITRLQQYLRIRTVHPVPDYRTAVEFLKTEMIRIGMEPTIFEFVPDKPMILGLWRGENPDAKAIAFASHMDVVPVDESKWRKGYNPFEARIDEDGNILARGAQDMKSVGMAYLEAIDVLKNQKNVKPYRNVFVIFNPEEEVGGYDGFRKFVYSDIFEGLNIGFGMDEGVPSSGDLEFPVFYGEKVITWCKLTARGPGGHGSMFIKETAVTKLLRLAQKIQDFRSGQELGMILRNEDSGNTISVNIDGLRAGDFSDPIRKFQFNVIPQFAEMYIDFRVPPQVSWENVQEIITNWTKEDEIEFEFHQTNPINPVTDLSDDNPYAKIIREMYEEKNLKWIPKIHTVATDARMLRWEGIPAIGVSFIDNTEFRLHTFDEYINVKTYERAIEMDQELIGRLSGKY